MLWLPYVATTNDLSSGTGGAESAQVLILNPANSGKYMQIDRLVLGTNVSTNNNIFRVYANPTITSNGTLLTSTCLCLDPNVAAPVCQIYKLPTISNNGTLIANYISGPTTSMDHDFGAVLPAGKAILITVRPNTTAVTYSVNVFWSEGPQ